MLQRKSKAKKCVIQREYDDKLELSVLHAECLRIYFNLRASRERSKAVKMFCQVGRVIFF